MPDAPTPDRAQLLPFYLVIDVSYSMVQDGKLDTANKIVPELTDALAKNPIISDKVRFGMVDFSDDARVLLPLCDLLEQDHLPGLSARGGTSYAAAFRALRTQIEDDVQQLKADGFRVHRPAVFFLSDGEPTDPTHDWQQAFRELTEYDPGSGAGFRMYPNVIPFGVADANPKIMQSLIHPSTGTKAMKMYLMDEGFSPADAIRSMAEILISSVLQSGATMAQGGSGVRLPDDDDLPAGVKGFAADDEDFL